jgi:ATP-dependent Clp protease ATP-binding subunit ClpC
MFERYNEKARQAVFFARYEASVFSTPYIAPEHLLLGIARADPELAQRIFGSHAAIDSLRQRFTPPPSATPRPAVPIAGDLPLNQEARRVLTHAEKQAQELGHKHIGPEHLLLGIVLEKTTPAAEALFRAGFTVAKLREEAVQLAAQAAATPLPRRIPDSPLEPTPPPAFLRDLTAAASGGELGPLIGRERELARIVHILSRRTKNNPVLIGEPGVGKTAMIEGLAAWIAGGALSKFAGCQLVSLDAAALVAPRRRIETEPGTIVCIEGLFDLAAKGWRLAEAMHVLEPRLAHGEFRCIATGTPAGLRQMLSQAPLLARHFEIVDVREPEEPDAVRIVTALLPQYEKFHNVTFAEGIAETAVHASGRFLPQRFLPDRALDLIDEAAARVRLRREAGGNASPGVVTADEIAGVISDRTELPLQTVKSMWMQPTAGTWQLVLDELAGAIPVEGNEWLPFLAVWLAHGSQDEAEKLVQAIRQAKAGQSE